MVDIANFSNMTRDWTDTTTTIATTSEMNWHRLEPRTNASQDDQEIDPMPCYKNINCPDLLEKSGSGYSHDYPISNSKFNIGKIHNKNYPKLIWLFRSASCDHFHRNRCCDNFIQYILVSTFPLYEAFHGFLRSCSSRKLFSLYKSRKENEEENNGSQNAESSYIDVNI